MENNAPENIGNDDSAADDIALDEAFDKLSRRISTLTNAFDKFSDRQEQLVGRDYSDDLAKINQSWEKAREAFQNLADRPALALTPDRIAEQIEIAGRRVRSEDHAKWQSAQNQLGEVARSLERRLGAARMRDEQNKWVGIGAGIAAILAFIAGCTAPPAVSRMAPESWHWPEQRAANMLSRDMWGAGVRLIQVADPDRWNALVRASHIYGKNETAIDACRKQAQRRKKSVPCTIGIEPAESPS